MSGQPASPDLDLLQTILRRCAEAAPEPWYPRTYAETTGVSRDSLDLPLEQLRLAGLVRLTDWMQGRGQGYALTPDGARVLESPRQLTRLRDGKLPIAANGPEEPPPLHHPGTRLYQQRARLREELENAGPPLVTRVLLLANILVFLGGLSLAPQRGLPLGFYLNGGMQSIFSATRDPNGANWDAYLVLLHDLGALHASDLEAGEWWRLLSCCFVHRGLAHLGMNMYALYILGQIVEKMWGRWRFLFIYLTAGLGGSCTAVLVAPGAGLVGASGAICGLLASVAAWIFLNRRLLNAEFITAWKRNLIVNFILLVIISSLPSVSWQAHLGGAAVGLIVSVPLNYQRFAVGWRRGLALAVALAVPVACLGAVAWETLERQKEVADFRERIHAPRQKAENKARAAEEAAGKLLEEAPQGRFRARGQAGRRRPGGGPVRTERSREGGRRGGALPVARPGEVAPAVCAIPGSPDQAVRPRGDPAQGAAALRGHGQGGLPAAVGAGRGTPRAPAAVNLTPLGRPDRLQEIQQAWRCPLPSLLRAGSNRRMSKGDPSREVRAASNGSEPRLPRASVGRLSLYLRRLEELRREGAAKVSSGQLAESLGVTDAQVRKDLAHLGNLGHPGIGYPTQDLMAAIRRALGIDREWSVALVGVGNLARALLRYRGFPQRGFRVVAMFDSDPEKVGQWVEGVLVHATDDLAGVVAATGAELGLLAVPAEQAQGAADALVAAGVRGILNFAPVVLRLPPEVSLVSVDLTVQLEQLAFLVQMSGS